MSKKFSPIIPLLLVTFLATAYVAIKTNNETKVLGEMAQNQAPETEINDVKLDETKVLKEIKIKNELGKIKTTIQNKNFDLKLKREQLNLKIKESTPPGEKAERELDNEIEKSVKIMPVGEDELQLQENEHVTRTNFPITVNQENDTISVTTPKGEVVVKDLPSTTVTNLIKNKVFTKVSDTWIRPSTQSGANAVLSVQGQTVKNFLGVFPVKSEVNAEVDPTTGEVTKLSTPWFQKTFGFLFSK